MITVEVDAGICGKKVIIKAVSEDMQTAQLDITSDCTHIREMAKELPEVNAMEEAFGSIGDTRVFRIAREHCEHAACPVPTAIIKAAEAACGLALPKNVSIKINKD
ncbi:MAG: DUF6951 family protein [Spirochaetia bacterium]